MNDRPAADDLMHPSALGEPDTLAESGPGRAANRDDSPRRQLPDHEEGGGPAGSPPSVFPTPGPDTVSGDAPAPAGPGAGAEPPQEPGYLDYTPNLPRPHNHEACRGHWLTRSCGCTRHLVWADGCGRRGCYRCGYGKSQASARRLWDRLYLRVEGNVQALVLTCPIELRPTFAGPAGAARWTETLSAFIASMKRDMALTWAYVRCHPAGEDGKTFAPHANILWQSSVHRGALDLDTIHRLWAQALDAKREVVLYASFFRLADFAGCTGLRHWCNYVERCFPGWTWAGQWSRWYGSYPPAPDKEQAARAEHCCPECGLGYTYTAPDGAALMSAAGLEALLDSGQPVHPRQAAAWSLIERIPPRPPIPLQPVHEQAVMFALGPYGVYRSL